MTTFASNTLALGPSAISADSLAKAGLAVVLLIVFAESGLLIGFFLPGDSVLFTFGLLISRGQISTPLALAAFLIGVAAVAGDQVGYLFGRKVGPALFRRSDSRLFKQEYVEQAHEFFEKYGPRSIVLARFVPVIRTFTPVVAGVSRMNYRIFVVYNFVGGILWGCGVTVLGYYLGKISFVRDNIEAMLVLVVLISVVPIVIEFLRARRRRGRSVPPDAGRGGLPDDRGDDVRPVDVRPVDVQPLDDPRGSRGAPGGSGPADHRADPAGWDGVPGPGQPGQPAHEGEGRYWDGRIGGNEAPPAQNDPAARSRRGGGRHSAAGQRQAARRD